MRPGNPADRRPALAAVPPPHPAVPYSRNGELQAWRSGRFKLQLVSEGAYGAPPPRQEHDPPRLYDLGEDPAEAFDLAGARPEELARLVAESRRTATRCGSPRHCSTDGWSTLRPRPPEPSGRRSRAPPGETAAGVGARDLGEPRQPGLYCFV